MWPLDKFAGEVLKLPGETAIAWAAFDPDWYRTTYPEVPEGTPGELLDFYLRTGQALGHSPNRMFDEAWHRARYPGVAAGIASGQFHSAFDSYCRRGCLDRSGHWLFDERLYRNNYPDLTDAVLEASEVANGYDHFLRHGGSEARSGHPLFDSNTYLAQFDPSDVESIRLSGVFQHYLARIGTGAPELRTSLYFDPDWYVRRYPEVARDIQDGRWQCALQHYMCNDTPTAFDPNESFSEAFYLERDPGLRNVIDAGDFRNGYAHFLRFGAKERRSPSASLDLKLYAGEAEVRADLEQGVVGDAFTHWLRFGSRQGQARIARHMLTDEQALVPFRQSALALLPMSGRFGYDFTATDPACSVVIPAHDGFAATMAAVTALHAGTRDPLELIVIDHASSDETQAIDGYIRGARVVRFDDDISRLDASNAGWQLACAPYVLFLAPDSRLAPGSVARARRRLEQDPSIGAVAGLVIRPRGTIAQAGGIVWADGGVHHYQQGQPALAPEANFVRDTDFGSLACLMVRRSALDEAGGLNGSLPMHHAAADLCLRLAEAGLRTVYDPSVMVTHDDSLDSEGAVDAAFASRHAAALARRKPRGGAIQVFARHASRPPHRILFLDDTVPLRRLGSGFVRSNDLVRHMAALGCAVTVYPVNGSRQDPAHIFGDMPETVEVMHTHGADRLKEFLEGRRDYYDTIWVCRTHNLTRITPVLEQLRAAGSLPRRVILDTEAVAPRREALQARLAGEAYDLEASMRAFIAGGALCDTAVAVTAAEVELLRAHGMPSVVEIGHMMQPRPTARGFAERNGMLFVGAIHQQDSPNYDSLVWFVEEVLPKIDAAIGWQAQLTIAGYVAPGVDMTRLAANPRVSLRGPIADLTPLYNRHRLFVAPTRFAAGVPYKVLEAAAFGLPVVATSLLAEDLGWRNGEALACASADDAEAFAQAVLELHGNERLWNRLRVSALEHLTQDYDEAGFASRLRDVLRLGEEGI